MALTEQERAVLRARLDEAREALHQMEIGRGEVSLSYNGESVTYAATNIGALRQYVRDLEAKLGLRRFARARSRGVIFG
ncbi:gpW family head-tail joining protein [Sinorhizobium meliloti]|uniref:gpW family head-tail joining protein n=1 Tax=Rhizobium meliloti TaxID=382 RepID=UPI000FDC2A68|nr:gpW family head-tail joining protein [Sinorhizobium meliloti]RVL61030.1 phage tail protein [Sinorhizobium meliloti]